MTKKILKGIYLPESLVLEVDSMRKLSGRKRNGSLLYQYLLESSLDKVELEVLVGLKRQLADMVADLESEDFKSAESKARKLYGILADARRF